MSRPTIDIDTVRNVLRNNPDRRLIVEFTKRTDGEFRAMLCHWNEDTMQDARFTFNPAARDLFPVWDREKNAHRYINMRAVHRIETPTDIIHPSRETPTRSLSDVQNDIDNLFG